MSKTLLPTSIVPLKKNLSTAHLLLYGTGTMLGAGIYVLVGKVAGYSGIMSPVSFLLAGCLAGLTAYSYAQLSSKYPESGGEMVYVRKATGIRWLSALTGWGIVFTGWVSAAAITIGFVGYLNVLFTVPRSFAILSCLFILGVLAIWGTRQSLTFIGLITLVEILGLILVIFLARDSLDSSNSFQTDFSSNLKKTGAFAIFQGAFLAFYAFIGFEDLANIAEEAKKPKKSMPIAIYGSLCIATLLYFLIAVVSVNSLPLNELIASDAPLADILAPKGQVFVLIISIISMVAVLNGVIAQIIMGARVLLGLAREKQAPSILKSIHPKLKTPIPATLLMLLVISILALAVPIVPLANATSMIILFVFVLVNLSQMMLARRSHKIRFYLHRQFLIPLLGFILSWMFIINKISSILPSINP